MQSLRGHMSCGIASSIRRSAWVLPFTFSIACSGSIGDGPANTAGNDSPSSGGHANEGGNGGSGTGPAACEAQVISPRVWRLSPEQYRNTVFAAFGVKDMDISTFPRDGVNLNTGFANGAEGSFLGGTYTNAMFSTTEAVASTAARTIGSTHPCMTQASVTDDCLRSFVRDTGRRAFRRPVPDADVTEYVSLYRSALADHKTTGAAEILIQSMLLSPHMLYRSELGDGSDAPTLDNYEIAAALAFGLTDKPPSDELLAAAEQGLLADPAERERVARQLAKTPDGREKMAQFLYWQTGLFKMDAIKGEIGEALAGSLVAENHAFVTDVLTSDQPTLERLYTGHFSYVDANLAPLYGLAEKPSAMTRVELPPEERMGIFTQPGWLITTHGPIFRGKLLREFFLCQTIPLPPENAGDLIMQLPETPPESTEREKWDVFVKERAGCAACHAQFHPLGFPFERYDERGRYRTKNEFGRIIATDGEMTGEEGWSGKFDGVPDLVTQILDSQKGRDCFAQRYMTFVFGQKIDGAETSCLTREVGKRFSDEGLDLYGLMAATAGHDTFINRAR